MEITNLENIGFDTLFKAFEKAFADYDIHFSKAEVRAILQRRGYNPRLSFAAFDNGEIAAFTLNGTGTFNGQPTAYDTGTGTAPQYRGQHLAARIFTHSIPYLRQAGISQYLLEVLQSNQKAIALYRRMNFEPTRQFLCFRQTLSQITIPAVNTLCTIAPVDVEAIRKSQVNCSFTPSWQNSIDSIQRGISGLTSLGAFLHGEMVGHIVFDPLTGDITQIAVAPSHRRQAIASRLLQTVLPHLHTPSLKILNVDSTDTTLPALLHTLNIPLASSQFEMLLPLPR